MLFASSYVRGQALASSNNSRTISARTGDCVFCIVTLLEAPQCNLASLSLFGLADGNDYLVMSNSLLVFLVTAMKAWSLERTILRTHKVGTTALANAMLKERKIQLEDTGTAANWRKKRLLGIDERCAGGCMIGEAPCGCSTNNTSGKHGRVHPASLPHTASTASAHELTVTILVSRNIF